MIIGIDIGKFKSSLCMINSNGKLIVQDEIETSVTSFQNTIDQIKLDWRKPKILAMESGSVPRRICLGLRNLGYKAIIIDARQAAPFLRSLRQQKTDKNDAYAIAELVRLNGHRETWIRSDESQRRLALLNVRDLIIRSEVSVRNALIGYLASSGHNIKSSYRKGYLRIFDEYSLNPDPDLSRIYQPLFQTVQYSDALINKLDDALQEIARNDDICQLLMSVPGVGPFTALRYKAYVDDPLRFATSREVGAYLGLVPRKRISGTKTVSGGITKAGSKKLRRNLFLAARTLMFSYKTDCPLKSWSLGVAQRRGNKCAMTGLARKLAVLLHMMWISNRPYSPNSCNQRRRTVSASRSGIEMLSSK